MENNIHLTDDTRLFTSDAVAIIIAFVLCLECAKEPVYQCEYCDKVYRQEARYNTHVAVCGGCVVKDTLGPGPGPGPAPKCIVPYAADDISELLRQNREMMDMLRKQQETIHLLVSQLSSSSSVSAK